MHVNILNFSLWLVRALRLYAGPSGCMRGPQAVCGALRLCAGPSTLGELGLPGGGGWVDISGMHFTLGPPLVLPSN